MSEQTKEADIPALRASLESLYGLADDGDMLLVDCVPDLMDALDELERLRAERPGREPTEKELSELGDVIELNDPIAVLEGDDPYELERAVWAYVAGALHPSVAASGEESEP
jgi:hypothetical protein